MMLLRENDEVASNLSWRCVACTRCQLCEEIDRVVWLARHSLTGAVQMLASDAAGGRAGQGDSARMRRSATHSQGRCRCSLDAAGDRFASVFRMLCWLATHSQGRC